MTTDPLVEKTKAIIEKLTKLQYGTSTLSKEECWRKTEEIIFSALSDYAKELREKNEDLDIKIRAYEDYIDENAHPKIKELDEELHSCRKAAFEEAARIAEDHYEDHCCEDCPCAYWRENVAKAIRSRIEEERRVMKFKVIDLKTGREADISAIVLNSYKAKTWAKNLVYCDIEGFAVEEDGTLVVLDECGHYAYPPQERFKLEFNEN